MGRPIYNNPQAEVAVVLDSLTSVQQGVTIAEDAWEEIFPAAFLMTSLVLQLVLLITGELRKYTSKVRLFAWLAYVGADALAAFLLGLLSRKTLHSGLWGLWSALLIYHLGGPDNFTAYERADSELWIRHLLYLVLQVVIAAYVIAVNTRGFFLIPTLLVFVVGVIRYYERNHALHWSSRGRLNEALAPIYEYMEHMQPGMQPNSSGSRDPEQLQYFVAGAAEWYHANRAGPKSREARDLVTTADIFEVVQSTKFASRACQLCVAFASSFAYLRRIVALTRLEQSNESSQSKMRRLWFRNEAFFVNRRDWMEYIHMERDFLCNWLYAKPLYPDTYLVRLLVRILCSVALFAALVLVIVYPSYNLNHDGDEVWGTVHAHARLKKDVTYVVLSAGFFVEIAYLLRLLASKRAVVAMLVAVVRTQRRRRSPASQDTDGIGFSYLRSCSIIGSYFRELWASFVLHTCKLSLFSNSFFEKRFITSTRKGTYLPRSNFFYRVFPTWHWLRHIKLNIPPTSWDQMYRAVFKNGTHSSFQAHLQGIEAQEAPALDTVLELIESMAHPKVYDNHLSRGETKKPIHMREFLDIFVVYYDGNWETILLTWWIGTLKVLILEHQSKQIQDENSPDQPTLQESESGYSNVKQAEATESSQDTGDHVQDINTGEEEEIELESSEVGSISEEKSTGSFEDKSVQRRDLAELRNRALWLMAYVCRLLTVCPELLPTHLELTKMKVAKELEHFHSQITNATNWMEDTRSKMESLNLPTLKLGERRSKEVVGESIASMRKEGFAYGDQKDVDNYSTELAVLLVDCMSVEDRWALIEGSAAHFVACLANASRTAEQCAKLTQGRELLTILWILFSHLGGGAN